MPLFKNLKDKVCQVLEPEVQAVEKAGWKELNAAEEALYREGLKADHALTSAVAIEEARVKAGLYDLLGKTETEVTDEVKKEAPAVESEVEKAVETAVDTAKKSTAKAEPASIEKPAETAANTASEGTTSNATK